MCLKKITTNFIESQTESEICFSIMRPSLVMYHNISVALHVS